MLPFVGRENRPLVENKTHDHRFCLATSLRVVGSGMQRWKVAFGCGLRTNGVDFRGLFLFHGSAEGSCILADCIYFNIGSRRQGWLKAEEVWGLLC